MEFISIKSLNLYLPILSSRPHVHTEMMCKNGAMGNYRTTRVSTSLMKESIPYTTTWKLFLDTNSSLGGSKTVNLSTNARKK